MDAIVTVAVVPPFLTVQDVGRFGYRSQGVAPAGVMDHTTFRALNALLGNPASDAVLEWGVSGGVLEFHGAVRLAIGGARVECSLAGKPIAPYTVVEAEDGDEFYVERFIRGRFLYVAVAGGLDVPTVFGSRSTYLPGELGGVNGRRLRRGDTIKVGSSDAERQNAADEPSRDAQSVGGGALLSLTTTRDVLDADAPVRIMRGPQADLFSDQDWTNFLDSPFTVSLQSDRMGYRLEGVTLRHDGEGAMLSEPTCIGAIQIPANGSPIVLMNDGPTVGGYPKIAVVVEEDLSMFAQRAPGDPVRFALI
jgi:antagonist of KipI